MIETVRKRTVHWVIFTAVYFSSVPHIVNFIFTIVGSVFDFL